jgi:hypothetical protein
VDLVDDGVPTAVRREALDAPGQLEGHGRPVTALRCRQSLVVQANLRTPPDAEHGGSMGPLWWDSTVRQRWASAGDDDR